MCWGGWGGEDFKRGREPQGGREGGRLGRGRASEAASETEGPRGREGLWEGARAGEGERGRQARRSRQGLRGRERDSESESKRHCKSES